MSGSLATIPEREVCVARYLMERNAAESGDRPFLVFPDASPLSWRGAHDRVVQIACGLARLGVRQGEHVLSWLPSSEFWK
jgi:crotonobetaine/carnitine-CoA ligase